MLLIPTEHTERRQQSFAGLAVLLLSTLHALQGTKYCTMMESHPAAKPENTMVARNEWCMHVHCGTVYSCWTKAFYSKSTAKPNDVVKAHCPHAMLRYLSRIPPVTVISIVRDPVGIQTLFCSDEVPILDHKLPHGTSQSRLYMLGICLRLRRITPAHAGGRKQRC